MDEKTADLLYTGSAVFFAPVLRRLSVMSHQREIKHFGGVFSFRCRMLLHLMRHKCVQTVIEHVADGG